MRTATTVEASGFQRWSEQRDFVVEAEKIGLDICWVAEAWGSDAPSALGYYAACTDLTGEVADGWLGTSFVPEGAGPAYFSHLDEGLARSGRTRADLDICEGAEVAFAPDEDVLRTMVAARKKELAFSLGGMGSASTNYYKQAYSRQGWTDIAGEVRARWQAGDRDGAAILVTDEMVLATTLIGTEPMVRERLRVWRDAGVTTVRLYPAGDNLGARLSTSARAIEIVHEVGGSS